MENKLPYNKKHIRKIILIIAEKCPAEFGLKNIVKDCKAYDVEGCLGCWSQALNHK